MSVAVLFSRSIVATASLISSVSCPDKGVTGAGSTHSFINGQGRRILYNDGYRKEALFFSMFASHLDDGVIYIDRGMKSACHYYDPDTGSGMWFWPGAAEKCSEFVVRALKLWRGKKHAKAMFFLGAAVHLVQDLCVPYHAACRALGGHMDFEAWVEKRRNNYRAESGGIYDISDRPEDWVAENARLAKDCFHLIKDRETEGYHSVAKKMLTRAQLTTAGFLLDFYRRL